VVEAKIEGRDLVPAPDTTDDATSGKVVDLVAALQASIDAAKSRRAEAGEPAQASSAAKPATKPVKGAAAKKLATKPAKKVAATKTPATRATKTTAAKATRHAAVAADPVKKVARTRRSA